MPAKKYYVELTAEERATLYRMLQRGRHSTRLLTRARILLKAAAGQLDDEIAQALETSVPTVERTRKRFTEVRLRALDERPRRLRHPGSRRA